MNNKTNQTMIQKSIENIIQECISRSEYICDNCRTDCKVPELHIAGRKTRREAYLFYCVNCFVDLKLKGHDCKYQVKKRKIRS